jgi:hypothetical protein
LPDAEVERTIGSIGHIHGARIVTRPARNAKPSKIIIELALHFIFELQNEINNYNRFVEELSKNLTCPMKKYLL